MVLGHQPKTQKYDNNATLKEPPKDADYPQPDGSAHNSIHRPGPGSGHQWHYAHRFTPHECCRSQEHRQGPEEALGCLPPEPQKPEEGITARWIRYRWISWEFRWF